MIKCKNGLVSINGNLSEVLNDLSSVILGITNAIADETSSKTIAEILVKSTIEICFKNEGCSTGKSVTDIINKLQKIKDDGYGNSNGF